MNPSIGLVIKEKLLPAPALGLLDIRKPFDLFLHERQGICLGVLTQNLDPTRRPVASFSNQLKYSTKGWPIYLRAGPVTCDLLPEKREVHTGTVSHSVQTPLCASPLKTEKGFLAHIKKTGQISGHPIRQPKYYIKGSFKFRSWHTASNQYRGTYA